jgi:WD40 repeat protein
MTRFAPAAVAFVLLGVPASATDPVPVWESNLASDPAAPARVTWVGFTPNGRTLAVRTATPVPQPKTDHEPLESARLWVYDVPTRKERFRADLRKAPAKQYAQPGVAFVSDDAVVVAGRELSHLRLADGEPIGRRASSFGEAAVWFMPGREQCLWLNRHDGDFVDLCHGNLPVAPRGVVNSTPLWLIPWRDKMTVEVVALDPVVALLAVSHRDTELPNHALTLHAVAIGDTVRLTKLAEVEKPHPKPVSVAVFSEDEKTLATGGEDGTVKLWDTAPPAGGWRPRATIAGPDFTVYAAAFRPDGKVLAFASADREKPNLWLADVQTGNLIRSFRVESSITAVAFSPDGKTLATGSTTGDGKSLLQLWDADALLRKE